MVSAELPDNWQELIAGYVLSNLTDDEVLQVERLLNDHPHLLQEVEAFQNAFQGFAQAVPPCQPPEHLRDKILVAAQRHLTAASTGQTLPKARQRFGFGTGVVLRAGAIIAASALLILGWRVASLSRQLQQANAKIEALEHNLQQAKLQSQTIQPVLNTLQQPGTLIYSLQGSDRANTASGSLVMSVERNTMIILVQNLPELPAGQIYRLWAKVPKATSLAYCGQFNTNAEGFIQLTPSAQVCGANPSQLLITIDALSDPTTKGGPVMMHSRT
jgi:hypothetical protein